jgi:O-antigen/teichoic acid export membrane protein
VTEPAEHSINADGAAVTPAAASGPTTSAVLEKQAPMPSNPAEPTPPTTPRRGRVLTNAVWIAGGFGYNQVLRLVSQVILARLLFPEAFGLIALTFTFITGLQLFSDLGIRTSIVQSPRGDDPTFLDTAWTLQIIRGFVLWGASVLFAWPAAYWRPQPEPDLLWLLPLLGMPIAIEGFTATKLISLHRHLAQRQAVLIDVFIQTMSTSATIAWALTDPNVRALTVGPILSGILRMILSHVAIPGRGNRLRWDRSSLRELTFFARWIYLGTVMTFLAGNVDKFVVGYDSLKELGIYHIANTLCQAAIALMAAFAGQIVFPLYSRIHGAGQDLRPYLRRGQLAYAGVGALLVAGLIAAGPTLIRCLFDNRYRDAEWIVPLLAIGAWFQIVEANGGSILFAQGKPRVSALSNAVKVLCLAIFIPIGLRHDGLRGLVLAFVAGDVGRYLTTAVALRRLRIAIMPLDLAWSVFIAALGIGAPFLIGLMGLPPTDGRGLSQLPRFAAIVALVVVVWTAIMLVLKKSGGFRERHEVVGSA